MISIEKINIGEVHTLLSKVGSDSFFKEDANNLYKKIDPKKTDILIKLYQFGESTGIADKLILLNKKFYSRFYSNRGLSNEEVCLNERIEKLLLKYLFRKLPHEIKIEILSKLPSSNKEIDRSLTILKTFYVDPDNNNNKNEIDEMMIDSEGNEKKEPGALYGRSLNKWISERNIEIGKIGLTYEEIKEVGPWITYLNLDNSSKSLLLLRNNFKENFPNLKKLVVSNPDIETLPELPKTLRSLELPRCGKLTAEEIKELGPLITYLKLDNMPRTVSLLEDNFKEKFQNLKKLSIFNTHISTLPEFPLSLEYLEFYMCEKLAALNNLKGLTNLRTLLFKSCFSIEYPPDLSNSPRLVHLSFSFCKNLKEAPDILHLTQLETADFTWCESLQTSPILTGSLNLRKLLMSRCSKMKTAPDLAGLTKMEVLDLTWCNSLQSPPKGDVLTKLKKCSLFMTPYSKAIEPTPSFLF